MTDTTALERHEQELPTHANKIVHEFELDLNAHGRKTPPGYRPTCTPTTMLVDLRGLLEGRYTIAGQLYAFRKVKNLKLAQRTKWRAIAESLLADCAQLEDPLVSRSRAERIAQKADIKAAVQLLQQWVYAEDEVLA